MEQLYCCCARCRAALLRLALVVVIIIALSRSSYVRSMDDYCPQPARRNFDLNQFAIDLSLHHSGLIALGSVVFGAVVIMTKPSRRADKHSQK
jgi:hypothetical protein